MQTPTAAAPLRAARAFVVAVLLVLTASVAMATPMPPRVVRWTRDADAVVVARTVRANATSGEFEVLRVLAGNVPTGPLATGGVPLTGCIPVSGVDSISPGVEVVLFLAPVQDGRRPLVDRGVAWLSAEHYGETVEQVLAIERRPAEERLGAYLAALASSVEPLREASRDVLQDAYAAEMRAPERSAQLVALVASEYADVRAMALRTLQSTHPAEALPTVLAASRSDDRRTREAASMALGAYDTEASVARLIELSREPEMTARALIDLTGSRRPEARAAIVACLDSADPRVRAVAARRFVNALERDDALAAQLHRLLDDPELDVRVAAIDALTRSRHPETPRLLLGVLRRETTTPRERDEAFGALGHACTARYAGRRDEDDARSTALTALLAGADDLPQLAEPALSAPFHVAASVLGVLRRAHTPACDALVARIVSGEFGAELAKYATR